MDSLFGGVFCMCWLVPFFGTAIVVTLTHGVMQAWRVRKATDADPHCERCGYNLHGVASLRCPECGTPLQVNTVLFQGDRAPMPLAGQLLMWTAFLPGPAIMLAMFIIMLWPTTYQCRWTGALNFSSGAETVTAGIGETDSKLFNPPTLKNATLKIETLGTGPKQRFEVHVDLVADIITWQDLNGQTQQGPHHRDTLINALADFKLFTGNEENRQTFATAALDMLARCESRVNDTRYVADGQSIMNWNTSSFISESSGDTASVVATLTAIVVGLAAWIWGIFVITRKSEREWDNYNKQRHLIFRRFYEHVQMAEQQRNPDASDDLLRVES